MTDYRYASGEEPWIGDTIRAVKAQEDHPTAWVVGDVFITDGSYPYFKDHDGSYPYFKDHDGDYRRASAFVCFELIARAGEPVRYQPGDVVELVDQNAYLGDWRGPITVTRVSEANGPWPVFVQHPVQPEGAFGPAEIKLVHRPAKAEPQVGDRVRVTFEGEMGQGARVIDTKEGGFWVPTSAEIEIIERAEKPLVVGDRVRSYRDGFNVGEIIAFDAGLAWVRVNPTTRYTTFTSHLERVP